MAGSDKRRVLLACISQHGQGRGGCEHIRRPGAPSGVRSRKRAAVSFSLVPLAVSNTYSASSLNAYARARVCVKAFLTRTAHLYGNHILTAHFGHRRLPAFLHGRWRRLPTRECSNGRRLRHAVISIRQVYK